MANEKLVNRENLKAFRQANDNRYAKPDGNYPTLTAGLADNFTPYSEDSGAEQENPFISNGTGTNNNTEIVTVGDYGLLKEKQGNTLVANQLERNPDFSSSAYWSQASGVSSISIANNIATVITSGSIAYPQVSSPISLPANHKALFVCEMKCDSTSNITKFAIGGSGIGYVETTSSTNWKMFYGIKSYTSDFTNLIVYVQQTNAQENEQYYIRKAYIIDLTQMFNGDIPQDLLDHPDHFSWYYNGSLAYNAGALDNANGVKLVSTGRNLWDEVLVVGALKNDGTIETSASSRRTTSFISIIPNTTYYLFNNNLLNGRYAFYDKNKNLLQYNGNGFTSHTFVSPQNAFYLRITLNSSYGTTYNHDITISLYYTQEEGGEGYNQYYPYEQPYVVDTGSEVLRKAGSVKDYKEPNGTIHRVVGRVLLKNLTFTKHETKPYFYFTTYSAGISIKLRSSSYATYKYPLFAGKYISGSKNQVESGTDGFVCADGSGSSVTQVQFSAGNYADATAFKSQFGDNDYLYYELAEDSGAEQGTPFAENLPINDYGMLYWLDENDNLVGIPQGAKIFYPTNYKGFVDDMYSRVDGDSSKYVIQEELLPQKDTTRLTQILVLTGTNSEDWSTSGSYTSVKRFNLNGTFARYLDNEHPRGIGTATSDGLTINWIQDSGFANITDLSACFYGGSSATVPQLILLLPNSLGVSTVEQLRTWLSTHNITIEYEYSKYKLVATLLNGVVTYNWEKD